MKTIMLKAAALTGFAALTPASLALSAYATEAPTLEPEETVISETEDGATVITKTITINDGGTEDENETVYYICDDDDLAAGAEPAEGSYQVLTFEETDALVSFNL